MCIVQTFATQTAALFFARSLNGLAEGLLLSVYVGAVEIASK